MIRADSARIMMYKPLCLGQVNDPRVYECVLIRYDEDEETVFLKLTEGKLTDISRDALYECEILKDGKILAFTGRVKDRYYCGQGNVLEILVQEGIFDKKSIKCVDKHIPE